MKLDVKDKPLSVFLNAADDTTTKLLQTTTPGFQLVVEVDELIRLRLWGNEIDLAPLPAIVAVNSYYSFLGAVRVALSGQAVAVFPLIRHGLECACYAYVMAQEPKLQEVWKNRHDGPEALKACRKAFGSVVSDVVKSIGEKQKQFGVLVDDIYQASIDFGAHPNFRSIFPHVSTSDVPEGLEVSLTCLYGEHDIKLQQTLVACAESGIASAFIIALAVVGHPLIDAEYTALDAIYIRVHQTIEQITKPPHDTQQPA